MLDGIRFASKREAARYAELKLLLRAGQIRDLKLQPRYALTVLGTKIGEYRADFEYVECQPTGSGRHLAWVLTAEDVKGFATPMFRWKRRHFEAEWKAICLKISK
jgi:hypothetical protein